MYDTDTRAKFIELRAKGWSMARIAKRLKVSVRTLIDWNRKEKEAIKSLRAIELEALHEKILASHEHELRTLKANLDRIEEQIAKRHHGYESIATYYRLAALLRSEIRKCCDAALSTCGPSDRNIEPPATEAPVHRSTEAPIHRSPEAPYPCSTEPLATVPPSPCAPVPPNHRQN
jgi:transposase